MGVGCESNCPNAINEFCGPDIDLRISCDRLVKALEEGMLHSVQNVLVSKSSFGNLRFLKLSTESAVSKFVSD